ncbi:MAG: sigma-54-dependent Fis family transcriptional regulator [Calditrichaceae bacterium]|nr:sigma-54-dependent Fis family transcriptional regulator [Calditrichia bacterium]NUQ41079.1 sigma-54-dependent Fis family transcriptional regulator [Calditrichaceae bacterium]
MLSNSHKISYGTLERLVDFADVLSQQNNFQEIVRIICQQISQWLNADAAFIMMANPHTRQTVKTIYREGQMVDHSHLKSVQYQISGWLMQQEQPLITPNIQKDPRFKGVIWEDISIESVLGIPLQIEGILLGALFIMREEDKGKFSEEDLLFLKKIVIIATPYLRNVQELQRYFNVPLPEAALLTKYKQLGLLGKSPVFLELLQSIEAAARCDVRVILEGQSGTGKELIARAIHQLSQRSDYPFVALDCGAIPEHLLESELFGHVKGAFTGANQDRVGLIKEADQGTLFLDEVANLPYAMQAKLLRVVQEGEVRPVGSNKSQPVDVRIITASSTALSKLVEQQKFREDLYYRLYVYPIRVPSLNERRDDIPVLAHHFLHRFAQQQKKPAESFHTGLLAWIKERQWKGNIRELENFVERLVTLSSDKGHIVDPAMLPPDFKEEYENFQQQYMNTSHPPLPECLAAYERDMIEKALVECTNNQRKAARYLKISESTLRYRMEKLGIGK